MGCCPSKKREDSDAEIPPPPKKEKGGTKKSKTYTREAFAGIARIELVDARMKRKDRWFAVVSLGSQTFKTATADWGDNPAWKQRKMVALEQGGPRICRISVFEYKKTSSNVLEGYCELDLTDISTHDKDEVVTRTMDLYNPNTKTETVGAITISYSAEPAEVTERNFAKRLLALKDDDGNGDLSLDEFKELMLAFGHIDDAAAMEDLFRKADTNSDNIVTVDELATLIALNNQKIAILSRCPVCNEKLGEKASIHDVIHLSLCFDEGTGTDVMTGGFLTEKQAAYGWMFKFSEWVNYANYDVGLHEGKNASHILVWDRKAKRIVEELIDMKMVLAMRAIYQSKMGLVLLDAGTRKMLQDMSVRQGKRMNTPESALDIPTFLNSFKGNINIDECKYDLSHYKTFNDFFIRELKEGVRPIAEPEAPHVAVCGADCRLMAFQSVDDATRFWIKGKKFSLGGLLASDELGAKFQNGSLVIFRLAPQDYHRFHVPVTGTIGTITDVPGHLFTVNPIAVNSKYCNVFTENKRAVAIIHTKDFGEVAFVAIGATMVGSITFTKQCGQEVKKGDEFGYFSFGGSTCIAVFREKAIEFDEDLLVNSEKSLETLVQVGMSLGVAKSRSSSLLRRPTIKDSVLGYDNVIAKQGLKGTDSVTAALPCAEDGPESFPPETDPFDPPMERGGVNAGGVVVGVSANGGGEIMRKE